MFKIPLDNVKKAIYHENNMKNSKFGFTLIELLIVIALLGALAVGLLAALDPFEQLKKGDDTGVRNTVSELHGAIIRYYAVTSTMPYGATLDWTNASDGYDTINLSAVVNSGELKADFSTLARGQLGKIRLGGGEQSITVCFKPGSKSFRTDPNTKYDESGVEVDKTSVCPDATVDDFACYWCVK